MELSLYFISLFPFLFTVFHYFIPAIKKVKECKKFYSDIKNYIFNSILIQVLNIINYHNKDGKNEPYLISILHHYKELLKKLDLILIDKGNKYYELIDKDSSLPRLKIDSRNKSFPITYTHSKYKIKNDLFSKYFENIKKKYNRQSNKKTIPYNEDLFNEMKEYLESDDLKNTINIINEYLEDLKNYCEKKFILLRIFRLKSYKISKYDLSECLKN